MLDELESVSAFLSSFISDQECARRFSAELRLALIEKYRGHWHLAEPERGSAYRAIVRSNHHQLEQTIVDAAHKCRLATSDLLQALGGAHGRLWLGERWTIWVDPGCVSLRIERTDGVSKDGQLIELYGKLASNVKAHGVPLASLPVGASVNISAPPPTSAALVTTFATTSAITGSSPVERAAHPPLHQDCNLLSPVKQTSRAIQILPPPSRSGLAALRPVSPIAPAKSATAPTKLLASPFVIPPTPLRFASNGNEDAPHSKYAGATSDDDDVFSPTPTPTPANTSGLMRSPSPLARSFASLSPFNAIPMMNTRRPSSRSSSHSSSRSASVSGESSDGEGSASDSIFSTESLASSVTSAEQHTVMWKGANSLDAAAAMLDASDLNRFLPVRPPSNSSVFAFPASSQHQRSHSSASNVSLGVPFSPGKMHGAYRSLPTSPSKPRRRGTRGGSGHGSQNTQHASGHEHASSISSMMSVTSASSNTSSSTRGRSTETVTEHSGGKVGVLGGGVLLGVAGGQTNKGSSSGNKSSDESSKRRSRDRRRGGSRYPPQHMMYGAPPGVIHALPTQLPHYGAWDVGM
ncbi:BTG domain-containing protein [Microbotryomycetes sp. JL221]|nr:BTG domain-containing protein [Microbotryomycetes sp. JL221]